MNFEDPFNVEIKEFDNGAEVKDIPNAQSIKKLADMSFSATFSNIVMVKLVDFETGFEIK